MNPEERKHFNHFLKGILEGDNMKDIRKRYRVLKVSSSTDEENGKEILKRISDVVPFHDSKDNSHSSSQLSRENSGWLYLNWNGSLDI
jgi:hypothetical protein